jgi:hypothetical protein
MAQENTQTSYPNNSLSLSKPLWQVMTTSFVHEPKYVASSDTLIFHFRDQNLVATQSKDGKTRWSFEINGYTNLTYQNSKVIFHDKSGNGSLKTAKLRNGVSSHQVLSLRE